MKRIFIATGVFFLSAAGLLLGQAPALPGTSADRIGSPTNYKTTHTQLYALDNNQNQQVRVIWANDIAQTVGTSQPWNFPYGSILLFEDYPTVRMRTATRRSTPMAVSCAVPCARYSR
jgi:hypothetical protein